MSIHDNAVSSLRKLMDIPDNYKVMFLQGGATLQFSMIPLNLLNKQKKCAYINSGFFAGRAIAEAKRYADVNVVKSSEDRNFCCIPDTQGLELDRDTSYLHITQNNTVFGTRFSKLPETGDVPLVADVSSMILSEPVDVKKYGLLYAGAQKNVGPAGLTIVIIREDLIGEALDFTPEYLNYAVHSKPALFNTPATYSVYMAGLVFEWLKSIGGVNAMHEINKKKAALMYEAIDKSSLYSGFADKADRSLMNATFFLPAKDQDAEFLSEAKKRGLVNLKGHKHTGGIRASIYNAMPYEGVKALADFMDEFERR